jgi:peptide/nickel transport system substrate-binding protein
MSAVHRLRTRQLSVVAAVLVACVVVAVAHAAKTTTLTLANSQLVANTDPWKAQGQPLMVSQAFYDTLLHENRQGNPVPWLASGWKYTNPKTLVLTLRKGVKFTDGTPFNSAAVKANLIYGQNGVTGGGPFLKEIKTITPQGPNQVKLSLSVADPDLPYDFTQFSGWMVSPKALKNPRALQLASDGTGPYIFDKSKTSGTQVFTLKHNPKYWNPRAFRFDTVVARAIADPNQIVNSAKTGVLNFAVGVLPGTSIPGWTISATSPSGLNGIQLNDLHGTLVPALKDIRVRQAMNYAVNRAAIAKALYHGVGVVNPSTPFTSGTPAFNAVKNFYPYNVAKAKQLLAAAGYKNGFTLKVLSLPPADQIAQAIAGYERAIGINLQIEDHTTDLAQQAQSGTWPAGAVLLTLTGRPFTDVSAAMTPASFFNLLHINDPKIDSYLSQLGAATTTAARNTVSVALAKYTTAQAWFVAPVLTEQLAAFDPKEVSLTKHAGAAQPNLYEVQPAG